MDKKPVKQQDKKFFDESDKVMRGFMAQEMKNKLKQKIEDEDPSFVSALKIMLSDEEEEPASKKKAKAKQQQQ